MILYVVLITEKRFYPIDHSMDFKDSAMLILLSLKYITKSTNRAKAKVKMNE